MNALSIDVLNCEGCGAAVPLGPGEVTACAYCGATCSLPLQYQRLRDVSARAVAGDGRAREVFERLGRAPPYLVRKLAFFRLRWLFVGGFMTVSIISLLLAMALRIGSARLGLSLGSTTVLDSIIFVSVIGVGLVLGAYGRQRGIVVQGLQRALAARPPPREGGPSGCRTCGAPLFVAAGALGVRCAYCGDDNLVRVDPSWLALEVGASREVLREATAALEVLRRQRLQLLRRLALAGLATVVLAVTCVAPRLEDEQEQAVDDDVKRQRDELAQAAWLSTPRRMRDTERSQPGPETARDVAPEIVLNGCAAMTTVPRSALWCYPSEAPEQCSITYFVGLNEGERLELSHASAAPVSIHAYRAKLPDGWSTAERATVRGGTGVATLELVHGQRRGFVAAEPGLYYLIAYVREPTIASLELCGEVSSIP